MGKLLESRNEKLGNIGRSTAYEKSMICNEDTVEHCGELWVEAECDRFMDPPSPTDEYHVVGYRV